MNTRTLLGLIASPRKMGNSEIFTKEIWRHLPETWRLRLIRLPELDIRPCTGCYKCLFGQKTCHLPDDLYLFLDALAAADACVVAAPAYALGANASLKRLQDRTLSFYGVLDSLWGKPAVGVAIAGINGMEGYAKLAVDSFIRTSRLDHRGSEVLYGALPGEIFTSGNGLDVAKKLASRLISREERDSSNEDGVPSCPTCGGDTFRFLPEGGVRCMLCSSSGLLREETGHFRVVSNPAGQTFRTNYESTQHHGEWLRSKKEAFLAKREELRGLTAQYAEMGEWIRPKQLQYESEKR
jgi:multimeric flavodoxin WrbA